MAASADVVNRDLIEIFESVPDYESYADPEAVRTGEDTYRIALGRLVKGWGDQLLEVAEAPPTPLTGRDVHTIDLLVERITAVLTQLNDLDRARTVARSGARYLALRQIDAGVLKALEEVARMMQSLGEPRSVSLWLKDRAAPIYRRFRRLEREIARRNQVLRARRAPWRNDSSAYERHA